ncbi:MAG TPA: GNAT family N-acetyltransferase [Spirochaetales bacterium]|nr:GNAT family N-acetyltransferase [Spirochaetales bacterium]
MTGDVAIRTLRVDEAEPFLALRKAADAQSRYLLYGAGERRTTVEEQARAIAELLGSGNSTILVAEAEGRDGAGSLVGYLIAKGGGAERNRHAAEIVVAILDAYTGKGIGARLFGELDEWARGAGVTRLGLGLMDGNVRARALYEKMGFREEGRRKAAFLLEGGFVDEILMYKLPSSIL